MRRVEVERLARKKPPAPSQNIAEWIVVSADPADASRLAQERCRAALLVKGVGVEPLAARIGEIGGAAIEPAEQEPFAANQGIREFKLWGS